RTDCFPHRVQVTDLGALSAQAHLGLWDFLGSLDLVGRITHSGARLDDPLPWALADRRCYRVAGTSDRIWARVLDPVRCLAARPWHRDGTTVLQITDPLGLAAQTLRVEVRAGQVSVTVTTDESQVQIAAAALAGLWLGTASVAQLAGAGQVVGSPAALAAFAELTELADPPYANTFF
ncbi:MAG: sterol carrier protein domain-containing protein, partial [Actinomycetia bacterium]|nr:sterol carrier protein domain-containing protein [Actinomycetes bacterium]